MCRDGCESSHAPLSAMLLVIHDAPCDEASSM